MRLAIIVLFRVFPSFPILPLKGLSNASNDVLVRVLIRIVRICLHCLCPKPRDHRPGRGRERDPDFKIQGEYVGEGNWSPAAIA